MKIAMIAVGYNRKDGMRRLLSSLESVNYFEDDVDLIISLDKSNIQEEMVSMVNEIPWTHGEKIVRAFEVRQGLRQHILQCGDLTSEYDAVAVFEDDITVCGGMYAYLKQTLDRYGDDERISGISLYKHELNPGCRRPFVPANNGYDVFLMQYAQSWGQCWNRRMWTGFREWYDKQEHPLVSDGIIPKYVASWDDKSWLKYYIKYTSQTGKYFVYPYYSLTNNNAGAGEHSSSESNFFQVPMLEGKGMDYRFPNFDDAVKYDAWFERILPQEMLPYSEVGTVAIDMYGLRSDFSNTRVLISTQILDYKILDSYKLKYRPMEMNLLINENGKDIYVYDMTVSNKNKQQNTLALISYDIKGISWRRVLVYYVTNFKKGIVRKIKKIFK